MKRSILALALVVLLGGVLLYTLRLRSRSELRFDTPYQAVLLDNGQFLYGKLERLDRDYLLLRDVYYVQQQVNSQTKEVKSILVRRGTEWHGPNRTIVSQHHVIMIETVTPGSKVAELIKELKTKGQ